MLHLPPDQPLDIVLIEGLTVPEAKPEFLADVAAAAPPSSTITVASDIVHAEEFADRADVIVGILDERLFSLTTRLRWVHSISSGVDMFMFDEFVESDVVLTGEKGLVGGHLADTGFGLLLALTRQIQTASRLGPDAWANRAAMRAEEIELEGLTMGIVGFGGTGRAMARRAVAFGMDVVAVDLFPPSAADLPAECGVDDVWNVDRLEDLLAMSDVVAICCPLTPSTNCLFDAARLAMMRSGAYLVNVTRGEIIDDVALVDALESGHLAGAALDVVAGEPLRHGHPLFGIDNVAMTPHTAGASQYRAARNIARFVRNLTAAQRGEPLEGLVDKRLGF